MSEHSERARYVTDQVEAWIMNDADYYHTARDLAEREGVDKLASYLTHHIRTAVEHSAPWQVAQELAPNDYARIHWDDVAEGLVGE